MWRIVLVCLVGLMVNPAFGDEISIKGFEFINWSQTLGDNPEDWPTITFHDSEVYLYGHGPDMVNTLSAANDSVRINGVPVYPKLRDPNQPKRTVVVTPEAQSAFDLDRQVTALKRDLNSKGLPDSEIAQAMIEAYQSDPALVDSAKIGAFGTVLIWWRGQPWADERKAYLEPETQIRTEIDRLRDAYISYCSLLEQGNLVIITTKADFSLGLRWADEVQAIRQEIERARVATQPLTSRTWPKEHLVAIIAEQFRRPLPIAGTED